MHDHGWDLIVNGIFTVLLVLYSVRMWFRQKSLDLELSAYIDELKMVQESMGNLVESIDKRMAP